MYPFIISLGLITGSYAGSYNPFRAIIYRFRPGNKFRRIPDRLNQRDLYIKPDPGLAAACLPNLHAPIDFIQDVIDVSQANPG